MIAEEQMTGSDTPGIIAFVQDKDIVSDIPIREDKRDTMCLAQFASVSTDVELSIAADDGASPFPTGFRPPHFGPKPIFGSRYVRESHMEVYHAGVRVD
jgi:hypothetical protein